MSNQTYTPYVMPPPNRRIVVAVLNGIETLYIQVREGWVRVDPPNWHLTSHATEKQLRNAHDTIREYGHPKTTYEAGETNDRHA